MQSEDNERKVKLISICIKCFLHEATRSEFCKDCFNELTSELNKEEDFQLPDLDEVELKW